MDEFISRYPPEIRTILQKIRVLIRKSAPGAEEAISYGIPTFKLNGKNLVHFSAHKNHIGFYPTSSGVERFGRELSKYETSRGTVRFPLGEPIPYALIGRIVQFRFREVRGKAKKKA